MQPVCVHSAHSMAGPSHLQAVNGTSYVLNQVWMPGFMHQDGVPGVALKQIGRIDGSDEERLVDKHLEKFAARCNEVCLADGAVPCSHVVALNKQRRKLVYFHTRVEQNQYWVHHQHHTTLIVW